MRSMENKFLKYIFKRLNLSDKWEVVQIPVLMFIFLLFLFASLSFYILGLILPYHSNMLNTSLTSSDLLIIAGLTITFYSLFSTLINKVLIPKETYSYFSLRIQYIIILNIIYVSGSIILIMIGTLGSYHDFIDSIGFFMLLTSWTTNFIMICTIGFTIVVSNYNKKQRNLICNFLMLGIIILAGFSIYFVIMFIIQSYLILS